MNQLLEEMDVLNMPEKYIVEIYIKLLFAYMSLVIFSHFTGHLDIEDNNHGPLSEKKKTCCP